MRPTPLPTRARFRAVPALAVAALLAGCSAAGSDGSGGSGGSTGSGGAAVAAVPRDAVADPATTRRTDTERVRALVAQHAQAVVLVDTVPGFTDRRVEELAEAVRAEHTEELETLAGWLEARGEQVPAAATEPRRLDPADHEDVPGMLSGTQLEHLADARGSNADRLFLGLMMSLHEGALRLVEEPEEPTADPELASIAADLGRAREDRLDQMHDAFVALTD